MITTHVLDTSRGRPAGGVQVVLELHDGAAWREVGRGVTDDNGRLATLSGGQPTIAGRYRLVFETGTYQRAQGVAAPFFPTVTIAFDVAAAGEHYHVPLLLSPFGYSTYRGS